MAKSVPKSSKSRPLTILAQDPSVCVDGIPLLTKIDVPAEQLAPGPCGYRIRVVDYDSSTGTLYQPLEDATNAGEYVDVFDATDLDATDIEALLDNPKFHQQNVFAIAMRVLGRFEFALGRRVSWQFDTHQLKVVPHAFREANAFYSRDHEALLFGYFERNLPDNDNATEPDVPERIYTCLSHDIIAHETTHAMLDGIRERFLLPSMPDQSAFHEGFSDLIAILSVTSVADLVNAMLRNGKQELSQGPGICIDDSELAPNSLKNLSKELALIEPLIRLGEEMGKDQSHASRSALRNSLEIMPSRTALTDAEFQEPHRRGELLVAAVLRALLQITKRRCIKVGISKPKTTDKKSKAAGENESCSLISKRQFAECFATSSRDMLNICIRALDYLVPVHVTFSDYLAGLLTADYEIIGNDSEYEYRRHIRESFAEYGIGSASRHENGLWQPAKEIKWLSLDRTDHNAMMSNPDEMFRFLWENRDALQLSDAYYTMVTAVNPTVRVGPDGMILTETVVEYVQSARMRGRELKRNGLRRPSSMPSDISIDLYGGGTLIFDVRGTLKYHIRNRIDDPEFQNPRLQYLWDTGGVHAAKQVMSISDLHQARSFGSSKYGTSGERWR